MDSQKTNVSDNEGASCTVKKSKAPRETPYKMSDHRKGYCLINATPSYYVPELDKNFSCDTCSVVNKTMSFNGKYRCFAFAPKKRCITMDELIDECRPGIDAVFGEVIAKKIPVKANFGIQILFQKINITDGTVDMEDLGYMSVDAYTILSQHDVDGFVENGRGNLEEKIEAYTNKGSNWIVAAIEQLILTLVTFRPDLM
jgi:hypothetical protein